MQVATRFTFVVVALAVVTVSVGAHHGWTGYADKAQTVTGTIRESSYENPHASVKVQAEGTSGKTWLVVLAPTTRMSQRGLTKDDIKVGTKVTVVGYQHKSIQEEMRAERITIAGKTTELR